MTKIEIIAIRKLPKQYVEHGTQVAVCNGIPFAVNGEKCLPIIIFDCEQKTWSPLAPIVIDNHAKIQ